MDFTSDNLHSERQRQSSTNVLSSFKTPGKSPNKSQKSKGYSQLTSQPLLSFIQQGDDEENSIVGKDSTDLSENPVDELEYAKELELINLNEKKLRLIALRKQLRQEVDSLTTQYKTIKKNDKTEETNVHEKVFLIRLDKQLNTPVGLLKEECSVIDKSRDKVAKPDTITVSPFGDIVLERKYAIDFKPMANVSQRTKYLESQYPLIKIYDIEHTDAKKTMLNIDIDGFRFEIEFDQDSHSKISCKIDGDFSLLELSANDSQENITNIVTKYQNSGNVTKIMTMVYSIIEFQNSKRETKTMIIKQFMNYHKQSMSGEYINVQNAHTNTNVRIHWDIEVDISGNVRNTLNAIKNLENDNTNFFHTISEYGLQQGLVKYLAECLNERITD